ncbi:MAG: hypothetical protein OEZ02_03050 [Anaerolineae bacterium]|nr:hypothetical protein [Anaerolineae bacterium]
MSDKPIGEKPEDFFCSALSQEIEGSILGSAPHIKTWLLLEHNGPWGKKALEESDIPGHVKTHLQAFLDQDGFARLLLIKQQVTNPEPGLAFFIALAAHAAPVLYRFQLNSYDDLLNIDFEAIAAGTLRPEENTSKEPLFLVCTNGKRDQCCAKFGLPVYDALAAENKFNVWQSSHVGGHRFAGNLVCFPHGIFYGRLNPAIAPAIAAAHVNNQITVDNLRGRSSYADIEQAAEGLLHAKTGSMQLDSFNLYSVETKEDNHWDIVFHHHSSEKFHHVLIGKQPGETQVFSSCIGEKQSRPMVYQLLKHKVI